MVLAAGFGTRLRPLTEELPKPLVPVGDRSVLGHVCRTLRQGGVDRVVINAHHLAARYDEAVLTSLGVAATMVQERQILGTAGGVAGASEALGEGPVVVHNGDILAELDLAALLASHERGGALATLAVGKPLAAGRGTVGLDERGAVVRLRGRVFGVEARGADFVGVQVIAAEGRARLPDRGCLVGDVYLPALEAGLAIHAAEVVTSFSDVGTLSEYGEANLAWLHRRGLGSWRSPSARVSDEITVAQSLVGAGAEVTGCGALTGCIVWPGARARAPAEGCIFTAAGKRVPWRGEPSRTVTPATAAPR